MFVLASFLCILTCSCVLGQFVEVPPAVRALVQGADPQASLEFCGAVSVGKTDYYLFYLQRKQLAGVVLIQQSPGQPPCIVDADTSLFPFRSESVQKPVQYAIESLLRKRNRRNKNPTGEASISGAEVCAVGRMIDRIVEPLTGFRLGSDSTREILRLLRTGSTVAVSPETAPPGSILVSPTNFFPTGPIYLGHAGIVGRNGSIYSADARYAGASTKNFSLTTWLKQFSGTNRSYAFVLHAAPRTQAEDF